MEVKSDKAEIKYWARKPGITEVENKRKIMEGIEMKGNEEEVRDWAKRYAINTDEVLESKCIARTAPWEKMQVVYNLKDEYRLFSGPHGRRIVAKLNRYKRRCVVLYCCCFVSVGTSAGLLYAYIIK